MSGLGLLLGVASFSEASSPGAHSGPSVSLSCLKICRGGSLIIDNHIG